MNQSVIISILALVLCLNLGSSLSFTSTLENHTPDCTAEIYARTEAREARNEALNMYKDIVRDSYGEYYYYKIKEEGKEGIKKMDLAEVVKEDIDKMVISTKVNKARKINRTEAMEEARKIYDES